MQTLIGQRQGWNERVFIFRMAGLVSQVRPREQFTAELGGDLKVKNGAWWVQVRRMRQTR